MKTETINYPLDPIAIVHCHETLVGGVSLDSQGYEMKTISVGVPVYKKERKYYPLKGGKLYEEAASGSKEIKLQKGSYLFKAGDELSKGVKVKKVDSSNEGYDLYELDLALTASLKKGNSLYPSLPEGAELIGVSVFTCLAEKPHVGVMIRGTLNAQVVPFSLREEERKKLPLILYHDR